MTILFQTILGATQAHATPACPLPLDAVPGDSCVSKLPVADDPLALGAKSLLYTQSFERDKIESDLSVQNSAGLEVASIHHTLYVDEAAPSVSPYATAYDFLVVAQTGRLRGEISPVSDTINPNGTLNQLGLWLQKEAGVWYLPLIGNPDPRAIDEAACYAACLISCWASGDGHGQCGQICGSICFWLVFTPW